MKYIGEKKKSWLACQYDWRALPSDALADENPIHSELQPSAQNRREAPPGTVLELLRATCKPRTKIGLEQWLQSSKQHVSSYVWMIYIYIIAMIAC